MSQLSRRLFLAGAAVAPLAACSEANAKPHPNDQRFAGSPFRKISDAEWKRRLPPQAYRTLRTAQTRDISFWTQFLLFTGNALWLLYGLYLGSWPLIIANCIGIPLIGAVLFMKIRHG